MFGFLYSWLLVIVGLWISWTKNQTLPNLRLLIISGDDWKTSFFARTLVYVLLQFLHMTSSVLILAMHPFTVCFLLLQSSETFHQCWDLGCTWSSEFVRWTGLNPSSGICFGCCSADFGPRLPTNQLYNNQNMSQSVSSGDEVYMYVLVSDIANADDAQLSRRKSLKKSLRESFRRLRKGRSQRNIDKKKPGATTDPIKKEL